MREYPATGLHLSLLLQPSSHPQSREAAETGVKLEKEVTRGRREQEGVVDHEREGFYVGAPW